MGKTGKYFLLLLTFLAYAYCNKIPVIYSAVENIREDLKVGEFAFQINATDPDGDPLKYGIRGTDAGFFEIDSGNGDVRIRSLLDRETNDLLVIEAVVNDGVYADVIKSVYIAVEDANDNQPVFHNLPYNRDVPENTPVGSTLFTASATDDDLGDASTVDFKIDEVVPSDGTDMFSISMTTGSVVLMKNLNYTEKSPFYQIRINASDRGGMLHGEKVFQSSIAIALIRVTDVPDLDPQFLNLPNVASIMENSEVGTLFFTVKARDPDTGINDQILFSIEDTNAPDLFQIDRETGEITVKNKFDREELLDIGATVSLTIKGSETNLNVHEVIASTTAILEIAIGDENDNGPEFYECDAENSCAQKDTFTGNVNEHSSAGLAVADLNIRVRDLDGAQNNKFNLRLEGPDMDAFSVSPISGGGETSVQVIIKNSDLVDYEEKTVMSVQIIAEDAVSPLEFTTIASVTININDINDNFPEFAEEVYEHSVEEHCEDGTVVATITATDADALDDGKIKYRLMPESIRSIFDVDANTGTIFVKDGSLLDWEVTNSYSPTLQALDSGNKIGSTVVQIEILDINDQTPEMNRDVYEAYAQENNPLKIQIRATDRDKPDTLNSKIQYHIEESEFSSNFTIDEDSGWLSNRGNLDREAIDPERSGEINLTVIASDMGSPSLSATAQVIINIGDENDNSPRFLDPAPYTFHVKESQSGILVGSMRAHDADQTEFNNRIVFSITAGSFGSFILYSEPFSEGYMGNITVDPGIELDYESEDKTYKLTVEAADLGRETAQTTVIVIVEDVNDTPPEFPSGITLYEKENTTLSIPVHTIVGTDKDTNHSLEYELVSTECLCNGSLGPCAEEWFTMERNGDIIASTEYVIDYEKCTKVLLNARVVDMFTEKNRNSTEGVVTINIVDINDNPPEFIVLQDFYIVVIEKVEKDTSVGRVYAKDRDTGENRKTKFKANKVKFLASEGTTPNEEDLFLYTESDGLEDPEGKFMAHIRSIKNMENNKRGKFLVEVEAFNADGLSSVSEVELLTVDTSYKVILRFDKPTSEVKEILPNIRAILISATKATVEIFNVLDDKETQRAVQGTIVEAYFVFPNGTALNEDAVTSILNSEEVYREYGQQLSQVGFTGISTGSDFTTGIKTELFIMVGVIAALAIILVVTTTSLVCIRRNYKRKLKAAKAMNSAATVVIQNQKSGPVVPGTNKYTKEGANPVLNMNIDTATDLGFDEDGSSADRESLNSLDYNIDMSEKDTVPMMVIEEEEEEDEDFDKSESPYIEPLGAALAQRERRRGADGHGMTFTNPAVDTTDL